MSATPAARMLPGVALLFVVAALPAQGAETALSGVHATEHFTLRWRPGSRAGASVERVAVRAERDLADICARLGCAPKDRFVLWLYDDAAELARVTGVTGTGGFSKDDASHVPHDDDQTRYHELVHLVAHNLLAKAGDEPRNLFVVEGLANALLEFVHGVHVDAVAKFYRARKQLPPLRELTTGDFYAWQARHPGFDAYDVAGSWVLFLLRSQPREKVTAWYKGASAKETFGKDEAGLERAWHAHLDALTLRPEVETLLRRRHGEPAEFTRDVERGELPAELLGRPGEWRSLTGAARGGAGAKAFREDGDALAASNTLGEWQDCDLGTELLGDAILRATIETPAPVPIKIQLGAANQALVVNGTFVYRGGEPVAHAPEPAMDQRRKTTDLALVRRDGRLQVWVDGRRVLDAEADPAPALPGIGIHAGRAVFRDVRVRALGSR